MADKAIEWANQHNKGAFPKRDFAEYRRQLRRIHEALGENCSAAAYGESQVGKSYLMSSLLSSPEHPFVITNCDKEFSFIDEINPSGGNNAKTESTGVVTRFTLSCRNPEMSNYVKIRNLSAVDILLLLTDAYYNDIKTNSGNVLMNDEINRRLDNLSQKWSAKETIEHNVIDADGIRDIVDYLNEIIGRAAANMVNSNFLAVASSIIQKIPYDQWVDLFSLLWNCNEDISRLFVTLINEYKKLHFSLDVYVPFDAVRRDKGTLLKIEWLDTICGVDIDCSNDEVYTNVYDASGAVLAKDYSKGSLSALAAELTFILPPELAEDRKFLRKIDLLDFPGARSREKYKESEIHNVLPKILRRGKVAYLFNKYSRSLRISSVLFCHHNDQKAEATIGESINDWIEQNIGASPLERTEMISRTKGISPLFLVATKFNIDLERTKTDLPGRLSDHWKRFDTVIPEIIRPDRWIDEWECDGTRTRIFPFRNIYPLRDFYWSGKNMVFEGYSDGEEKSKESCVHRFDDYPNYFDDLRKSFLSNNFVKQHFANPEQTWEDVATVNNDGSKAIIRSLDIIAPVLDDARRSKYLSRLRRIQENMLNAMKAYYEPEDEERKNQKVRQTANDISRDLLLSVGAKPETFGHIIDNLMIPVDNIRDLAYDIVICHKRVPEDFTTATFLRSQAEIDIHDERQVNVEKLRLLLKCDNVEQLEGVLKERGTIIEDVISNQSDALTTVGRVVAKEIEDYWTDYVNSRVKVLVDVMSHSDDVVRMLIALFRKLRIRQMMAERIDSYCKKYNSNALPNVIADYASLTLNNFVSSIGQSYISDTDMKEIREKAMRCDINVDFNALEMRAEGGAQSLEEALKAFDKATDIDQVDLDTLRRLPLWNNFFKWYNLVSMGLIYASDISNTDVAANKSLKRLIDECDTLYKN